MKYKEEVYLSNYFFEKISENNLSAVDASIETLIRLNLPIHRLALMLVTPENAEISQDGEYPKEVVNDEKLIRDILHSNHRIDERPDMWDFRTSNLESLGNTRRTVTNPSLSRLLKEVESGSRPDFDHHQTCCLIALYITGIVPTYHVVFSIVVVNDGHHDCSHIDESEIVTVYRKFEDGYWKVKDDFKRHVKLTKPTNM
ncbi:uncharacterized protein LOC126833871 [Adelges cooleyi]|uniref:uncharacterized protein LOC126833871 n=1 Tax=Adelges cooleyi TaxID=133065 RepID=UPI0021806E11|nr:uncharacterized protein LOC126833871 [Adelges cooleyi]